MKSNYIVMNSFQVSKKMQHLLSFTLIDLLSTAQLVKCPVGKRWDEWKYTENPGHWPLHVCAVGLCAAKLVCVCVFTQVPEVNRAAEAEDADQLSRFQ